MNRRKTKPRYTTVQWLTLASVGVAFIVSGNASLFAGHLFFRVIPGIAVGWIFAPFAIVVGTLIVLMAIRFARERRS